MTRAELNRKIETAAGRHGFQTGAANYMGFTEIKSEELNFTFRTDYTEDTDWAAGRISLELTVTASVRKMGGSPTFEELLRTADEIRRGAELIAELQSEKLVCTDHM